MYIMFRALRVDAADDAYETFSAESAGEEKKTKMLRSTMIISMSICDSIFIKIVLLIRASMDLYTIHLNFLSSFVLYFMAVYELD